MNTKDLVGSVKIPPGETENFKFERFTITPDAAEFQNAMDALKPGRRIYAVRPGEFTRLCYKSGFGDVLMSDTDFEVNTNLEAINEATGDVLIFGLGLGLILNVIMEKPDVKSVTVVELHEEIINYVGPHYKNKKLKIIQGDAYGWTPPPRTRYDYIYYDIWGSFSTDLVDKMKELKKDARKFLRKGGKVRCWIFDHLKMLKAMGM